MNLPDEALVKNAVDCVPGAFAELASRYRDQAVRFCTRILQDHQAAEDVAQDGFVNLFNSLDRYVEKGRFRTFFFKILANLCIDAVRRRRRLQPNSERMEEVCLGGIEEAMPDPDQEEPYQRLARKEKALAVRSLISRLPEAQRTAIEMRELRGFKYREISTAMNCRINRVKVLIFRGRRNLARLAAEFRLIA